MKETLVNASYVCNDNFHIIIRCSDGCHVAATTIANRNKPRNYKVTPIHFISILQ